MIFSIHDQAIGLARILRPRGLRCSNEDGFFGDWMSRFIGIAEHSTLILFNDLSPDRKSVV